MNASSTEKRLVLDWTKIQDVFPVESHLAQAQQGLVAAKNALLDGSGKGSEFLGWVRYPVDEAPKMLEAIKPVVEAVTSHSDAIVVIGIGGSYLGTRAISQALTHAYSHLNPSEFSRRPLLFWAGNHMASDELAELLDALDLYTPSLIVVSKSGGTTEPAMAFRILKRYMEDRFGNQEARERIFAITDPEDGILLKLAKAEGYPCFPIPKNVGGRYSVFTPVGLLPLAIAGVDVEALVAGATQAFEDASSEKNNSLETNVALCYAGLRNVLYKNDFNIEALCTWSPKLTMIGEWWKQLFGESDAKGNTGIFPASVSFTTDLHSMGQYFQDGERHMFATHIRVMDEHSIAKGCVKRRVRIPSAGLNDGFQFLNDRELFYVQSEAQQGTVLAHADGKLPTMVWEIPEMNAWWLGYWLYTNMFACGVAGYARGINPFDQPGVEAYKNNMFALLGKPGYGDKGAELRARIERGHRLRSLGLTTRS
jgi:glucose-6-phosphate isomerase